MITKQEMFDRAWFGLKDQGWQMAADASRTCVYYDVESGRRCAWGWVDPEGTRGHPDAGGVRMLAALGVGLAAALSPGELEFAYELQQAHDNGPTSDLRGRMEALGRAYGLTIPEEES